MMETQRRVHHLLILCLCRDTQSRGVGCLKQSCQVWDGTWKIVFESAKKVALGFPPTSETLTGNESITGLSTMTLPSFTQGVIFLLCNIVKMGVGPQNEAIICQALLLVVQSAQRNYQQCYDKKKIQFGPSSGKWTLFTHGDDGKISTWEHV